MKVLEDNMNYEQAFQFYIVLLDSWVQWAKEENLPWRYTEIHDLQNWYMY